MFPAFSGIRDQERRKFQLHVFFESLDLIPEIIPVTINPTLTKANTMTIKREFSLAEGSAIALRINSKKPIIINIEGK